MTSSRRVAAHRVSCRVVETTLCVGLVAAACLGLAALAVEHEVGPARGAVRGPVPPDPHADLAPLAPSSLRPTATAPAPAAPDAPASPSDRAPDAPPEAPGADAAPTTGRVTGRVVAVGLDGPPSGEVNVVAWARGHAERPRALADLAGAFALDLPPGRWTLAAQAAGWASTRADVEVKAGAVTKARTLRLAPARDALVGAVVTTDGRPIVGARVTIDREGGGVRLRRRVETAAGGAFRAEGLADGLYRVSAEAPGFVGAGARRVPVAEGRGGVVDPLVLVPAATITGTLRRVGGAPEAGARVTAYDGRRALARARTDDAGAFAITGLGAGAVVVMATADDGALVAQARADLVAGGHVRADLLLVEAPSVTGRVTGPDGAPRAGVRVEASAREGDLRRAARTDDQGRYTIARLSPGAFVVTVVRRGAPAAARAEVALAAGPTACDLVVRDGVTVRGVVLTPEGAPLARAGVFAIVGGRERARARSDGQGRFELVGLSAGEVRLLVRARGDALVGERPCVLPGDGGVDGLELVAHAPARLRGRARDPFGRPLGGVTVVVRGGPVRRTATTDAQGRFDLGPLYDGDYRVSGDRGSLALAGRRLGLDALALPAVDFAVSAGRDVACELVATRPAPVQQ